MPSKSQKKVSKPFSREQKFMVVLFAFLLFDIFTHFTHPAYKYYREFSKKVHDENTQFQKKILGDFIPVISLVASNGMQRVEVSASSPSVSSSSFKSSDSKETLSRSVSLPRGSNFFTISGVPHISVCGFVYQVGDYFDGSPILYLNPICMETRNCRYQILTETRSTDFSQQQQPQMENINNAP